MITIRKLEWHLILFALLASLALVGCGRLSQQQDQADNVNIALAVHPDPPGSPAAPYGAGSDIALAGFVPGPGTRSSVYL